MEESKYILVLWPDSQIFMDHPRFNECYLAIAIDDQPQLDSAYFIPEDLYIEITGKTDKPDGL